MTRIKSAQQTDSALKDRPDNAASKPLRMALLEFFEMISGIYQDLRGDTADTVADFFRPMRKSWRRFRS